MRKVLALLFTALTVLGIAQKPEYSSNRIILRFKQKGIQTVTEKKRAAGANMVKFGIYVVDKLNEKYSCKIAKAMFPENNIKLHPASLQDIYILTFSYPQNIKALIKEYMSTGQFEYVQPDFIGKGEGVKSIVPDDPYFSKDWDLNNNGSFVITGGNPMAKAGADINMECGWGITTGDTNVLVAVIDCGCQRSHPELSGRIWKNPNPGILGYPNDVYGWDFAYNDSNVYDNYGHGTNVTGIIGANGNNGTGFAGINWHCKLLIVKVLDDTDYGYTSNWALGVMYATDYGANIINMSLESENDDSVSDPAFQSAIDYAYSHGALVVACMGNFDNNSPVAPADMSHVMAIGATTTNDWRAVPLGGTNSDALPGSCFNTYISVVAPGDEIYSISNELPDCYCWYWFGTSQACPHVVGLASLMLAVNPHLTNNQLQQLIEETADKGTATGDPNDSPTSWNEYYGYGRINACRALDTVLFLDGMQDINTQITSVQLFPNPFSDEANLIISNFHPEQIMSIAIYDTQGRKIKQFKITAKQTEISREGMGDGLYFYRVTSGIENIDSGKFIIVGN